jgi:serine/threonine protein phosphatase PrpC
MKMLSAIVSKPGGKTINEGAAGCLPPPPGGLGCWVVADGQGNRGGGDIGARKTVRAVLDTVAANPGMAGAILLQALEAAQQEILALQAEIIRNKSIRVAAAVLCSDGRGMLWAHIGDARIYVFRDGEVIAQSKDHSVPQTLANAGEITPAQIRGHAGHHHLLRSIGAPEAMQPSILEQRFAARPGDLFLLCSAGFWLHVTELAMQAEWCKSASLEDWLERMEIRLLQAAPADHGNYSAIALLAQAQNHG